MAFDPVLIASGSLRHPVTILQSQPVQDVSGTALAWVPFLEVRASVTPMRGTDLVRSGQDTTLLYITVGMRYQGGITSAMRVQTATGTYSIQAIENVQERNRRLNLFCLALGANQ